MRAIWTGSIAFGLVNVPVKAYGATSDHDIDLHQVHEKDGGRIRYQRRCEICGEKVSYKDIDKAYDDGEQTVVLTDEEMEALPAEKSREIEVVQFVPAAQIDPLTLERSYYLEADSKSPKAYELLRRTLEDTEKTAIVRFALRQKTRLGVLRVRDKVLVLQAMMWADEIRATDFAVPETSPRISAQELKMSASLVEQFSADFTPEDFEDDYQVQLRTLIEAKLAEGEALDTDATFGQQESGEDSGGEVIDLMEALKRSIDSKSSKSSQAKPAKEKPAKEKAAKAKPAKKSPAKKSTSKKSTSAKTGSSTAKKTEKAPTTQKKKKASSATDKRKEA